jgi:hypothetical protein
VDQDIGEHLIGEVRVESAKEHGVSSILAHQEKVIEGIDRVSEEGEFIFRLSGETILVEKR